MATQKSGRSAAEEDFSPSIDPERCVDLDDQLNALVEQADRCRRLAGATHDREVAAMLETMAQAYERSAKELSQKRGA